MSECILLIGHGSRQEEGNDEIRQFAAGLAHRRPEWAIETCWIEFADPELDEGLDRAAARADEVIAVPLILNAAGHVKLEIPEHLEAARQRHPGVRFACARHLGAGERVLDVLGRRVKSCMQALDVPDPQTTSLILLGRGSSDRAANGEVSRLARWLYEGHEHALVDTAFTGVTHPRLETVVDRHWRLGARQQIILPYYLFTGRLIDRIERQVERLRWQYPQTAFALADYVGFEPEIFETLEERVEQARTGRAMLECDGCPHRRASGHHHHHHH